ncbi:MAG: PD-(D/E)XK nuclease family transposase [Deltaproteobacteria bacterium]|nr:PD-(D/E)XK nuclease family transposase [Deltaproteobacteria bacterium]
MKRVSPINDFFFRYLFGKTGHEHLTLEFINSVLDNMGMGPIHKVTIRNPFSLKESVTDKETILDIKAEDEHMRVYNIEMQIQGSAVFTHRALYYWAKTYASQISEGDSYKKLSPVICINVHDFKLFDRIDRVHTCFLLKELRDERMLLSDHQMLHFLCLTTFRKLQYTDTQQLNDWLQWFIHDEDIMNGLDTLLERNPTVKEAHDLYTQFTADKELMEHYEARQKYLSDLATLKEDSHDAGYAEGKADEKQAIALAMRQEGIEISIIYRITGLSVNQIKGIEK